VCLYLLLRVVVSVRVRVRMRLRNDDVDFARLLVAIRHQEASELGDGLLLAGLVLVVHKADTSGLVALLALVDAWALRVGRVLLEEVEQVVVSVAERQVGHVHSRGRQNSLSRFTRLAWLALSSRTGRAGVVILVVVVEVLIILEVIVLEILVRVILEVSVVVASSVIVAVVVARSVRVLAAIVVIVAKNSDSGWRSSCSG